MYLKNILIIDLDKFAFVTLFSFANACTIKADYIKLMQQIQRNQ